MSAWGFRARASTAAYGIRGVKTTLGIKRASVSANGAAFAAAPHPSPAVRYIRWRWSAVGSLAETWSWSGTMRFNTTATTSRNTPRRQNGILSAIFVLIWRRCLSQKTASVTSQATSGRTPIRSGFPQRACMTALSVSCSPRSISIRTISALPSAIGRLKPVRGYDSIRWTATVSATITSRSSDMRWSSPMKSRLQTKTLSSESWSCRWPVLFTVAAKVSTPSCASMQRIIQNTASAWNSCMTSSKRTALRLISRTAILLGYLGFPALPVTATGSISWRRISGASHGWTGWTSSRACRTSYRFGHAQRYREGPASTT